MQRMTLLAIPTLALIATLSTGCASRSVDSAFSNGSITRADTTTLHMYEYYPDSEVYFSEDRNLFFWEGENGWQASSSLPVNVALDRDHRVAVPLYTDTPHRVHASVLSMYPGSEFDSFATAGVDGEF